MSLGHITAILRFLSLVIPLLGVTGVAVHATPSTTARTVTLNDEATRYRLGRFLDIHEDHDGHDTIDVLLQEPDAHPFTPADTDVPGFGFSPSDFWARCTVTNLTRDTRTWLLELDHATRQRVNVFDVGPDANITRLRGGSALPLSERAAHYRSHVFPLRIQPGETHTLYVQLQGESRKIFPLTLWSSEAYQQDYDLETLAMGAYFGLLAGLIVYNAFLFFSVRETAYGWYVLFLAGFMLVSSTLKGFSFLYLWPETPALSEHALPVFMCMTGFFSLQFTAAFLDTSRLQPRSHRWIRAASGLGIIQMILVASLSYRYGIMSSTVLAFLAAILSLCVGAVAIKQGNRAARYYMMAWLLLWAGVIARSLRTFELLPATLLSENGHLFGSASEALLLSFALAARLRGLREEKESAMQQMMQQDKLATLGMMSAGIAHEINNPNNFVRLSAQNIGADLKEFDTFLRELLDSDDNEIAQQFGERFKKLEKHLALVNEGTRRIDEIVSTMRKSNRKESGSLEAVMLESAIESTLTLVKTSFGRDIDFRTECSPSLRVLAHASQLAQVLTNLVINGCQAIESRLEEDTSGLSGLITIQAVEETDRIRISIRDNGCGMTDEVKQRLFEPFFTTKGPDKGTGLGMGICKSILTRMNGTLEVTSVVGEGTSIIISLPAIKT